MLLDNYGHLKLADFGTCMKMDEVNCLELASELLGCSWSASYFGLLWFKDAAAKLLPVRQAIKPQVLVVGR